MSPKEKQMVDLAEKHIDAALADPDVVAGTPATLPRILRQFLLFAKDVIVAIRQDG